MSFYNYKDTIENGDLVLAFIGRNQIKPLRVDKGEVLNTRYGHFKHEDMIGMKYGDQMEGARGYGFVHLLHPTPELWTVSLPHRTQIVYSHDSAYIIQRLNVTSGTRVIEAGTGSASFTHSFARTVGLEGKVFTYEFHEPRFLEAQKEIEDHGINANTFITHRDVCQDGFEINSIPSGFEKNGQICADVVFLDLPSPWTAITKLDQVISKDSRVGVCCFSPCIEQVHKTVEALQEYGWINIEMVEVAGKRWEAHKDMVRDVNDAVRRLKDIHSRRGKGLETRKVGTLNQEEPQEPQESLEPDTKEPTKRKLEDSGTEPETEPHKLPKAKGFNPFGRGVRVREGDENFSWRNVTRLESEIKSHTSYLTFATKLPPKVQ